MENTKESIRAKAFNKVWSKVINVKREQNEWYKAPNAFLENEEISGVGKWFDRELEVYQYILDLITQDK
jgi:hypothetical protein